MPMSAYLLRFSPTGKKNQSIAQGKCLEPLKGATDTVYEPVAALCPPGGAKTQKDDFAQDRTGDVLRVKQMP